MILDASKGVRGKVIDLDTWLEVPYVKYLNTETGYLEAYQVRDGKVVKDAQGFKFTVYQGRFKFVPTEAPKGPTINLGADHCSICKSKMVLKGDDLCPACRAKERGQKNKMQVEKIGFPLFDVKCQLCSRMATWYVSDEVEVTPELHARRFYSRGVTVGRRAYCSWCFKPPRLLDDKGEVMQELESIRPS
jgi:hypothetical protein